MSSAIINVRKLLFHLAIPAVAGLLGSIAAGDIGKVYSTLNLPGYAPAPWVFGAVWPILYILMGLASYLTEDSKADIAKKCNALLLFRLQLIINMLWPTIFFRLEEYKLAFWLLAALLGLVLATTLLFLRISKAAGGLMIPYALWLVFALFLNYSVASLN